MTAPPAKPSENPAADVSAAVNDMAVTATAKQKARRPRLEIRTPKGTVDLPPRDARAAQRLIGLVTAVFEAHGGQPISTPTFELRDILMNKYGDGARLVYDLSDQGGDSCSLRYDLTVPFARFLTAGRIQKLRRYQIGNVFRRDNPSFRTGRLREFTQADFDICGECVPGLHDSEALAMVAEILGRVSREAGGPRPLIRVNDRRVLAGLLEHCGVPAALHGAACSAIDKADKISWAEIAVELEEKGVPGEAVRRVRAMLERSGGSGGSDISGSAAQNGNSSDAAASQPGSLNLEDADVAARNAATLAYLTEAVPGDDSGPFRTALRTVRDTLAYASALGATNILFDLSLARGLDYYTGLILEAGFPGTAVGSVVGGGRYDGLCASLGGPRVSCVGFSVGISRLLALLAPAADRPCSGVYVASAYSLCIQERLAVLGACWKAGVRAETFSGRRVNLYDQLEAAKTGCFAGIVIVGEEEWARGEVSVLTADEEGDMVRKYIRIDALPAWAAALPKQTEVSLRWRCE